MDVVGLDELMSPYGDYSQDVLNHAITQSLDDSSSLAESYPLMPVDSTAVVDRIKKVGSSISAIVIQFHEAASAGHWLCFRKDDDGTWWNSDSFLDRPVPMGVDEAAKQVEDYVTNLDARLFEPCFHNPSVNAASSASSSTPQSSPTATNPIYI